MNFAGFEVFVWLFVGGILCILGSVVFQLGWKLKKRHIDRLEPSGFVYNPVKVSDFFGPDLSSYPRLVLTGGVMLIGGIALIIYSIYHIYGLLVS